MDGIPEINRAAEQGKDETATTVLPPPTEVKIRTMKSDVASMQASGGGMPQFQNVKVSGLALENAPKQTSAEVHKSNALMIALITIVALVILGVLIYFGYRILA